MLLYVLAAGATLGGAAIAARRTRDWRPAAACAALGALLLTVSGWHRGGNWLPPALALTAAAACAAVPALARYLLSLALIGEGLYGFVIARDYAYESWHLHYVLLPVGDFSKLSYLVLPQAYLLIALGGWLGWRTLAARPRLARAVLGPRLTRGLARRNGRQWAAALPLVTAMAAELYTPAWWFGSGATAVIWTVALGGAVLAFTRSQPELAADLAAAGLIALGMIGIVALALGRHPGMESGVFDDWLYGLVVIISKSTQGLALGQGVVLAAAGGWLLTQTAGVQLRNHHADGVELRQQVRQLTRTRSVAVHDAAAELRRVERDLHDGAQSRLIALGMSLGAAERLIPAGSPALALVAEAKSASAQALQELRDIVRGVCPPVLADRGLRDAIEALVMEAPIRTTTSVDLPGRLAAPIETACYFAIAETLTNAVRHSGAELVQISVRRCGAVVRIEVSDDGAGGADPAKGSGLAGLERRLAPFDGIVAVSSPPGGPTIIAMELACGLS